jgi:hypothetical protein
MRPVGPVHHVLSCALIGHPYAITGVDGHSDWEPQLPRAASLATKAELVIPVQVEHAHLARLGIENVDPIVDPDYDPCDPAKQKRTRALSRSER